MNLKSLYGCVLINIGCVISSLTNLKDISYYEIVELRHVDEKGRNRRDVSTYVPELSNHLDETKYLFFGHGRHFNLQLYKNRFLIPDAFKRVYQHNNNTYRFHDKVDHCYYHGYLADRKKSSAAMSTCYGLNGVINDEDDEEFRIEPHPYSDINTGRNVRYILFKSRDVMNQEDNGVCGVNETDHFDSSMLNSHDHSRSVLTSHSKSDHERSRRSTSDMKYVEVVVVMDNLRFKDLGEDLNRSDHRAFEILNIVDHLYKTMNTRVAVVNIVVWNIFNMASVSESAGETLGAFEKYTRDVLRGEIGLSFDNAQLLTIQKWGNLVGLAGVGTVCSLTSSAINRDHNTNPAITANTVAHEMGHNIGFMHYSPTDCKCTEEPCVMSRVAPHSPCKSFTDCSVKEYAKRYSSGDLPCLLDYPGKLYGDPKCGNGYIEEGEECDCGSQQECKKLNLDACCDFSTCKLHRNAQCATGSCCENCKYKKRGVKCRGKQHSDCDLEEFCTGRSSICPKNFHLQDGSPCNGGTSYCYQGTCKTHDRQCEMLWGPNAKKAEDKCFGLNTKRGNEWANCGKNDRGDFLPCAPKDVLCGKLQCAAKSPLKPLPTYPIIGRNRGRNTIVLGDGTRCILGKTQVPSDLEDPTMTVAGIRCGNNSICVDHKCASFSSLSYIKKCSDSCIRNGGVCNNNGNCHCPKGYACPHCELAGPGGSLDSGQGCVLHDNCEDCFDALTKALLIVFLLIIPMIVLIICIRYRHTIRERCCRKKPPVDDLTQDSWTVDEDVKLGYQPSPRRPPPPPPYIAAPPPPPYKPVPPPRKT